MCMHGFLDQLRILDKHSGKVQRFVLTRSESATYMCFQQHVVKMNVVDSDIQTEIAKFHTRGRIIMCYINV